MPCANKVLWAVVTVDIVIAAVLAPFGWVVLNDHATAYIGPTITALVAYFYGSNVTIVVHAVIAGGIVLWWFGWGGDLVCFLKFLAVWLVLVWLPPSRLPTPRRWLIRRVRWLLGHQADSPFAGAASTYSGQFVVR